MNRQDTMKRRFGSVTGRLLALAMLLGGLAAFTVSIKDIKRYLKLRSM